jgi:cobyrinic acid a,c-diamide synthase
MKQINRIMFAGTKSGAGKTTLTCGILQGLMDKGYVVSSFKCGPDYIDPMFHSKVIGTKSGNLDSFFTGENLLKDLLYKNSRDTDISVIEGVMGYYDGIGFSETGSSYSIAAMTKTPVILIVDAKGMSGSLGALLKGFISYKDESYIKGVIFNRLPDLLYDNAKKLAEDMGIHAYGYVPVLTECILERRHLGLVTADEIKDLKDKMNVLAHKLSDTIDFDGLLALANEAEPLEVLEPAPLVKSNNEITIAVAQDEAFCFIYKDNLELLKASGAVLLPFSPLRDKELPKNIDGLLLCGGYPELYAKELSQNTSMLAEIKRSIESGMPTIAECGGFMYLHDSMEDKEGTDYPMAGVIPGRCFKTTRLQRFGYIYLQSQEDSLITKKQEVIKAHEFHYWDSEDCGKAFHAVKPGGTREWDCIHASQNLYAGFPHLYFYGNPAIAERFLERCNQYGKSNKPLI